MTLRLRSGFATLAAALLFVAAPVMRAQAQDFDAGDADAGETIDGGDLPDGGDAIDAGPSDAGAPDSGSSVDAGTKRDAGVIEPPDGSVGEGGADRDNPEADDSVGRIPTTCTQTIECAVGFRCEKGLCRYTGIRDAEGGFGCGGGCGAGSGGPLTLLSIASAALLMRRRCRRRSR